MLLKRKSFLGYRKKDFQNLPLTKFLQNNDKNVTIYRINIG
ncbi:hypothetical protein HMPREF0378_1673 [Eubacterium nodatum ATCC 33099]|nr:hypothetical protein HMPREF0378_1673 [Eubacterium nodatum ATCC 33099]